MIVRPKRRRVFHSAEHQVPGAASFRWLVGLCLVLGTLAALEPLERGAALLAMQVVAGNAGTSNSLGRSVERTLHPDGVSIRFERWVLEMDGKGGLLRLSRRPPDGPSTSLQFLVALINGGPLPDDIAKPLPEHFTIVQRTCRILSSREARLTFSFWHPKNRSTAVLDRVQGNTAVGVGPLSSLSLDGIGVKELILYPVSLATVRRPRLMPERTLLKAVLLQYLRGEPAGVQTLRPFGIRLVSDPIPTLPIRDLRRMDPELGRSQRWVYTATIGSQLICVSATDARLLWHSAGIGNGKTGDEGLWTTTWGVWLGGEDQGWLRPTHRTAHPTNRILLLRGAECQYARYDSESGVLEIDTPDGRAYFTPDAMLKSAIKTSIKACPVPEWRLE